MQLIRNKGNGNIYIPGHHVCNHLDLQLGLSYLLFGRDLGTAAEQVRHFCRRWVTVRREMARIRDEAEEVLSDAVN